MELESLSVQKRAEKTKLKNVFCIPKQLDGLKTLLDHFLYIYNEGKRALKIHHERNKNLKRNRTDRM
jgi:hypothetical protein